MTNLVHYLRHIPCVDTFSVHSQSLSRGSITGHKAHPRGEMPIAFAILTFLIKKNLFQYLFHISSATDASMPLLQS